MRTFKQFLVIAALTAVALLCGAGAQAQFHDTDTTKTIEYCHIDVVDTELVKHRDLESTIEISKDRIIINLEDGVTMEFEIGEKIDLKEDKVRPVKSADAPDSKLAALYIQDQVFSIRNMETNATMYFLLNDLCMKIEKMPEKGWKIEKIEPKRQTD